jgi:hypothetical protein
MIMEKKGWTPSRLAHEVYKYFDIAYTINPAHEIDSWDLYWLRFLMSEYFLIWLSKEGRWG